MKKPTLVDRIRYAFDNSLSRGTFPLIGWLAVASVILVIVSAAVLSLLQVSPVNRFVDLVWLLTLHTLGKSVPNSDGAGWLYLILMLLIGYGGVFITGTLIAVLTEMVRNKIADLRQGRSRVIESGHTVILGWSPQVFTIVEELVEANRNQRAAHARIAILAEVDKVAMEDEIRAKVTDARTGFRNSPKSGASPRRCANPPKATGRVKKIAPAGHSESARTGPAA